MKYLKTKKGVLVPGKDREVTRLRIKNLGPHRMWVRRLTRSVQSVFEKPDEIIYPGQSYEYDPRLLHILSFDGSSDYELEEV